MGTPEGSRYWPGMEWVLARFLPGVERLARSVHRQHETTDMSDLTQIGLEQVAHNAKEGNNWDYRVWSQMSNYARKETAQSQGQVPLDDDIQKEAARSNASARRAWNRKQRKYSGLSPEEERANLQRTKGFYRREDLDGMLRQYQAAGEHVLEGHAGWEDYVVFRADMKAALLRLYRHKPYLFKLAVIVGIQDNTVRDIPGLSKSKADRDYQTALDYLHWILNHKGVAIRE